MDTAYVVITVLFALMVAFSGLGKIQLDQRQVRVIHETVGVPLKYFPHLSACEFAGAIGLVVGSGGRHSESRRESASSFTSWGPSRRICTSAMSKALGLPPSCWCSLRERSSFAS
jgi:hypothetical protein